MTEIPAFVAFVAGLISFLSPCVLPLIPGFLAYLAGGSISESHKIQRTIFLNSVFFVLGFASVFSLLGVILNTILLNVAMDVQTWLSRIGGLIIIFFGMYLVGLIKVPFLEAEHRLQVKTRFSSRYLTSFVFGAAFAVGWTPCVGAVLGGILGLAASSPGLALTLLFSYAMGLGLPFLAVGLFTSRAAGFIKGSLTKFEKPIHYVNLIFGAILIGIGILIFTQTLSRLANFEFLNRWLLS